MVALYREGLQIGSLRIAGKKTIGAENGKPLLIRWILLRLPGFGIFLHKFLRDDYDRALHDHPFPFISIILKGGYYEIHNQTIDGKTIAPFREVGSILLRPAEWRHRVMLGRIGGNFAGEMIPSWSVILVGRRCRRWGFFTSTGWCWWRKYNYQTALCEEEILWHDGND